MLGNLFALLVLIGVQHPVCLAHGARGEGQAPDHQDPRDYPGRPAHTLVRRNHHRRRHRPDQDERGHFDPGAEHEVEGTPDQVAAPGSISPASAALAATA